MGDISLAICKLLFSILFFIAFFGGLFAFKVLRIWMKGELPDLIHEYDEEDADDR